MILSLREKHEKKYGIAAGEKKKHNFIHQQQYLQIIQADVLFILSAMHIEAGLSAPKSGWVHTSEQLGVYQSISSMQTSNWVHFCSQKWWHSHDTSFYDAHTTHHFLKTHHSTTRAYMMQYAQRSFERYPLKRYANTFADVSPVWCFLFAPADMSYFFFSYFSRKLWIVQAQPRKYIAKMCFLSLEIFFCISLQAVHRKSIFLFKKEKDNTK